MAGRGRPPSVDTVTFREFWAQNVWARDAAIPAVLLILALATAAQGGGTTLFSMLLIAPLFWRRSFPETVTVIVAALALVQVAVGYRYQVGDLAVPLVVHAATAYARNRRWGWSALLLGLLGAAISSVAFFGFDDPRGALTNGAITATTVAVAFLVGRQQETHARDSAAAVAERDRLLQEQQIRRSEMAAAQERTRIARELHDIVAHSLSVVVVQAEGGRAAARTKPELAPEVLATIAGTARAALGDMRRLVGVLRTGGEPESSHPDFAPAPTLGDVADLVAQVSAAGQRVQLQITGEERPVPPGAGLAAYRLVQESLTNVIKHAGSSASTEVNVHYAPGEVHVSVLDDGRGAAAAGDGQGNGLIGMRERVTLQGGTVAAHARSGGGFIVTATIPTPQQGALAATDPAGNHR